MRTLVFGDIHGCREALVQLLDQVHPDPARDTLVFLGDYVDRGPDARGVINELMALRQEFPRMFTLKGNHEAAFLEYLSGREKDFFLSIGGKQTLESYGMPSPFRDKPLRYVPEEHLYFLHELLPYWEDKEFIFVHAGLQPGVHLTRQSADWLYWGAGKSFMTVSHDFGKRVVFGHNVVRTPFSDHDKIGIDTGAVYGGSLTCLILPDLEFVSVPCPRFWPA